MDVVLPIAFWQIGVSIASGSVPFAATWKLHFTPSGTVRVLRRYSEILHSDSWWISQLQGDWGILSWPIGTTFLRLTAPSLLRYAPLICGGIEMAWFMGGRVWHRNKLWWRRENGYPLSMPLSTPLRSARQAVQGEDVMEGPIPGKNKVEYWYVHSPRWRRNKSWRYCSEQFGWSHRGSRLPNVYEPAVAECIAIRESLLFTRTHGLWVDEVESDCQAVVAAVSGSIPKTLISNCWYPKAITWHK